ncbi:unnamed protein product [Staurois parvus]|uniref:Uncharacterized protein n=1 Tax=Staurois parvus TaxID=386267 RepID=A0ABN9ADC0_9NEOB|nr:unnamed protein product [Staurois parvus]
MTSSHSNRSAVRCVPQTQRITDQRKEPKISATCQCPSEPAVSAHPCHLPVPISATSMPHFSAYQCT